MIVQLLLALGALGALGALSAPTAADDAWRRVDGARAPYRVQVVGERGYGTLRIEGDALVRTRAGEESVLGCTDAAGHGAPLALARDPAGLVFVATERGLFVTSPEVDVVHPVERLDGAPRGAPNSVFVDARRRVWLATGDAFGCLDPSFYFGRTIDVPAPGPYTIQSLEPQAVVLSTGNGLWRYRFDRGPAPRVARLLLDGQPLEPGAELTIEHGDALALTAAPAGEAEVVFRYRVDQHHVWRALDGPVGADVEPGEHLLEVVAEDRDLRLSEPVALRLVVDYPFYYRKAFVVSVAGALLLVLFACFQLAGRDVRPASRRLVRSAVSTVLVLVIALQVLAGVVPHGRGWPFIGYSMYTTSLDVGHVAYNGILVGLTRNGRPRDIPLGALGVAADNRWQVLGPLIRGGALVNAAAVEKYNGDRPTWPPIVRLQVWAERTLLSEDGPLPIAQLILSDHVHEEAAR